MSTIDSKNLKQAPIPVAEPLPLNELGTLLAHHYGLTNGLYDLLIEYQIGSGNAGPDNAHLVPSVMVGAKSFGLIPVTIKGPNTIDASLFAPKKSRRKANKP